MVFLHKKPHKIMYVVLPKSASRTMILSITSYNNMFLYQIYSGLTMKMTVKAYGFELKHVILTLQNDILVKSVF